MAKRAKTRTTIPSVLTAEGFVAWIADHVPQSKRPGQTPLQAACWYWAYEEALVLSEETTRHVAQHLLTPHPGYSALQHVQEQLYGLDDEQEVIEALCVFWGVEL